MITIEQLEQKLKSIEGVTFVKVEDQSGGCGSAFFVIVVAESFEGKGVLERQKVVNACIKEEMKEIHAVSMKTFTPKQWETKKGEFIK